MPRWLNTLGRTNLAIGICGRCKMKRAYVDLVSDTNYPGLKVCVFGCVDQKDPYRLPARSTEKINLRYARPDADISVNSTTISVGGNGDLVSNPATPPNGNPGTITT